MFKKTDLICDILEKDENAEEILTNFGFHCIYCPAAQMESLEEASYVHGVDVDEVVNALNANARSKQKAKATTKTNSKTTKSKTTKATKTSKATKNTKTTPKAKK